MTAGLPKVSIPKASGGGRKALSDLDSEVTWYHFLYTVLVRVVMDQPRFKQEEGWTFPFKGKMVLMAVIVETGYHSGYQGKCIIET